MSHQRGPRTTKQIRGCVQRIQHTQPAPENWKRAGSSYAETNTLPAQNVEPVSKPCASRNERTNSTCATLKLKRTTTRTQASTYFATRLWCRPHVANIVLSCR